MNEKNSGMVLVVDDDENVCKLISGMLAQKGFTTAVAANGKAALEYLRKSRQRPGLILLDLMMPEMTGWEFRRIQQDDPAIADIPVAIITGMEEKGERARGIGVVDVLFKPSRIETLTDVVSRFCK